MVDQRKSRRFFKQVKDSGVLTEPSHDLHACGNVLMHIDMFNGMHTSLGTGALLVRMCESWEKFMVDQRRSRLFFKQVKHSGVLTDPSHDLHACGNVLMHIDMFMGMYTSLNLVPTARARLGQRRPRVHGLWDNQQPEARFLASCLKEDTADPREGCLGIYRKGQKKRQPPPLPFANNCHSLGFIENKTTQKKRCK